MTDRKALTRQYKETPPAMGVMRVYNSSNDKSLVEASRNVTAAINRHRFQLNMGKHPNAALISDWKELGAEAFRFEVLDTLEPPRDTPDYDPTKDLSALEDLWVEKLEAVGERGYNSARKDG